MVKWATVQHDGPNHLVLWLNGLLSNMMTVQHRNENKLSQNYTAQLELRAKRLALHFAEPKRVLDLLMKVTAGWRRTAALFALFDRDCCCLAYGFHHPVLYSAGRDQEHSGVQTAQRALPRRYLAHCDTGCDSPCQLIAEEQRDASATCRQRPAAAVDSCG